MIHGVWCLCKWVCVCLWTILSCAPVGMKLLQTSQLLINDPYQSWFPSWLSALQHLMHPHRFDCSQAADSVSQLAFSWGKRTPSWSFFFFFFLVISPEHCEVNWSQTTRMLQVTEGCSHNWIPGGCTYYLAIFPQYTASLVRLDTTAAPLWQKSVIWFILNHNYWFEN